MGGPFVEHCWNMFGKIVEHLLNLCWTFVEHFWTFLEPCWMTVGWLLGSRGAIFRSVFKDSSKKNICFKTFWGSGEWTPTPQNREVQIHHREVLIHHREAKKNCKNTLPTNCQTICQTICQTNGGRPFVCVPDVACKPNRADSWVRQIEIDSGSVPVQGDPENHLENYKPQMIFWVLLNRDASRVDFNLADPFVRTVPFNDNIR